MKRKPGLCNIEEREDGTFRVRAFVGGKLKTIASKLKTRKAAEEYAAAYALERNASITRSEITLAQFGVGFLARRRRRGVRGVDNDELIWNKHIRASLFGTLPVGTINRADVLDWLDGQAGKAQGVRNRLNLVRLALGEAVDRGLLETNPARDVKLHKARDVEDEDTWTVLTLDEQRAVVGATPERWRPLVTFALATGLRWGEVCALRWADVSDTHAVVRRTKSGKNRKVPLLPSARTALNAQPRRGEFVFPARDGSRRISKAPKNWKRWVAAAGIDRNVRWHDLRHTCGTSLLGGWWGARWPIERVQQMLGHSTVQVTERYAHLLQTELDDVAETVHVDIFPQGKTAPLKLSEPQGSTPGFQDQGPSAEAAPDDSTILNPCPDDPKSGREGPGKTHSLAAWALAAFAHRLGVLA